MQKDLATAAARAYASINGGLRTMNTELEASSEFACLRYAIAEVALEGSLRLIAPPIGRRPPALHRWPRLSDGSLGLPSFKSLKANVAALRFEFVLCQIAWRERKSGFDENEPRRSRGEDGAGEWTDEGGDNGGSTPSDVPPSDHEPLRITIHPPSWYEGGTDGSGSDSESPPLEAPPTVPEDEPDTTPALNDFAKAAAYWLARAALKEVANPLVGTFINLIEAAYWSSKVAPYIRAYLDPPKSWEELHRAVSSPAKGYDIHHIAEKTSARKAGYPRYMIGGAENLVRIPTLKHWQITGWYMTANDDFAGLSPREYLQNKNWNERMRVGRQALEKYGVLKP
jgi:hypothetical protein